MRKEFEEIFGDVGSIFGSLLSILLKNMRILNWTDYFCFKRLMNTLSMSSSKRDQNEITFHLDANDLLWESSRL